LDLFDEVLDQIGAYYVEPISATSFVAHGTESLYLALANDRFVQRHARRADPESIARMRKLLRDQYWNKPLAQRAQARQVVSRVCDIARSEVGVSDTAVIMEYVFGGCNVLDDYSGYLTPDRLSDLYGNIEGEFVGLGIEMKADEGKGMLLVKVLPGSPASEGGLRRGEHIVVIDGRDCRKMSTDDAARFLRGPSGSTVALEIEGTADGRIRNGMFVRRAVHVKSIPVAQIIDRERGIAYIQMTGFQKSSPSELDEALRNLHRQGMRALIWDLRENPGGLLTAAWEVADRFIDEGAIVSTRGRTSDQNLSYPARQSGTWKMPLVLLVDGDSASASEIIAGAVRDHHRATIVGRQTFGKWSVQSIFPLRNATGLRLTTAKFYSPNGQNYGKIGVEPDVLVEVPKEHATYYRGPEDPDDLAGDNDIRKAVEILGAQISRR
jgi:carboxyl-terminal processing protease